MMDAYSDVRRTLTSTHYNTFDHERVVLYALKFIWCFFFLLPMFPFPAPLAGVPYGPTFTVGDTIGVGYYPFKREIFFTKNGHFLGVAFSDVPPLDYHIGIGMCSNEECVMLNAGQQPFTYKEVSQKHIKRPDIHWGVRSSAFAVSTNHLKASWTSDVCGIILSNASLMLDSRPAPVHSDELSYFELTIPSNVTWAAPIVVTLGFTLADHCLEQHPGWDEPSYALHGDNGCLYSNRGDYLRPYTNEFQPGDTIGCGFDRKKREIFFTLNGRHLGVAFARVAEYTYHACVGVGAPGAVIQINFGMKPFQYEPLNQANLLRSPTNNTIGRHSYDIQVSEDRLTASLPLDDSCELVTTFLSSLPLITVDTDLESDDSVFGIDSSGSTLHTLWPRETFLDTVGSVFGPSEDEELVTLLTRRAEKSAGSTTVNKEQESPLAIEAATFVMTPEERVTYALLNHIFESRTNIPTLSSYSNEPSSTTTNQQQQPSPQRQRLNPSSSRFLFSQRIAFLQVLNDLLLPSMILVNFSRPSRRSLLSRHFRDTHVRSLFFQHTKKLIIRQALNQTSPTHDQTKTLFMLRLDLFKAQKLLHQGRCDLTGTKSIFGQAFQALHFHRHEEENKYGDHDRDPMRLLVKFRQKPWRTVFKGMYADDYGGLYRDMNEKMCKELQSSILPLFIPCPNAREQIGLNRNHYVPNPSATSPIELNMFEFLGKLLGVAMRSGELLTLDFPSIVWKSILEDPILEEDVMSIDRLSFKLLHELYKLEKHINTNTTGISSQEFKEFIDSNFVVIGSDMKLHELVPGGENIPVTWSNRVRHHSTTTMHQKNKKSGSVPLRVSYLTDVAFVFAFVLCVCAWCHLLCFLFLLFRRSSFLPSSGIVSTNFVFNVRRYDAASQKWYQLRYYHYSHGNN